MQDIIDRTGDMVRCWWTCVQLTADSQSVMAMRLMGLSGVWHMPHGDARRMVGEKAPAFAEALTAGLLTASAGRGPDRVICAIADPLSRRARRNRIRLLRAGPRLLRFPAGIDIVPTEWSKT